MLLKLEGIACNIVLLWGWKRGALALMAGAISALSMPPLDWFPILFVSFSILVWLLDGTISHPSAGIMRRHIPAFTIGWWFGFGYFFADLWWIASPFIIETGLFFYGFLAIFLLSAMLSIFWGGATLLAFLFWSHGWHRIFALAFAFSLSEWLRGYLFVEFSSNMIGYAALSTPVMMQIVSLTNIHVITALSVLVFASAGALMFNQNHSHEYGSKIVLFFCLVLVAAQIGFGIWRLSFATDAKVPNIRLRLVQSMIDPVEKWKPENWSTILKTHLELSAWSISAQKSGLAGTTHLIWPELALPFSLSEHQDALVDIGKLLPPGTSLITGAIRVETISSQQDRLLYNSVLLINEDGEITAASDKTPHRSLNAYFSLDSLLWDVWKYGQWIKNSAGFAIGGKRKILKTGEGSAFLPLIGEEIAFSVKSEPHADNIGWMINLADDSRYNHTLKPYQNLRQAQLQAVKKGKPVVRVANNGISAIIDPYGRILEIIPYEIRGITDSQLPRTISVTFIRDYANILFTIILFCFLILTSIHRFRR